MGRLFFTTENPRECARVLKRYMGQNDWSPNNLTRGLYTEEWNKVELNIKPLSPNMGKEIPFPAYATVGSACMDLRACLEREEVVPAGGQLAVPCGFAMALPSPEYVALIFARSGLAVKLGIAPANCVGVIDSDYRGEVTVVLRNHTQTDYPVHPGDRIAQMAIMPVVHAEITIEHDLEPTARGSGGFGSTGV